MFDPVEAVAATAQVQGFFELAHDPPQRAAHAVHLDIAAAPYAVFVSHQSTARSV
jgi:hypothetical protein